MAVLATKIAEAKDLAGQIGGKLGQELGQQVTAALDKNVFDKSTSKLAPKKPGEAGASAQADMRKLLGSGRLYLEA